MSAEKATGSPVRTTVFDALSASVAPAVDTTVSHLEFERLAWLAFLVWLAELGLFGTAASAAIAHAVTGPSGS